MRIALLNARYAPYAIGGAARSVQLLAEFLAKHGHAVQVICQSERFGNQFSELEGVDVAYLGAEATIDESMKTVGELLREFRPQVVHTNYLGTWQGPAIATLIAQQAVPWVHTLREYSLICEQGTLFTEAGVCEQLCSPCGGRAAASQAFSEGVHAVVGISEYVLRRHRTAGLFSRSESLVIHNMNGKPPVEPGVRHSHSPLRLGYLGRLSPEKGVDVLLSATKLFAKEADWELRIAGTGEAAYTQHLQQQADLRHTSFLGHCQPASFFREIDLLVVPSVWPEPLGRVIHEAYQYGVPVVCSQRGGMPEIVEHGVSGLVCSPLSASQLAALLKPLLTEPATLAPLQAGAYAAADRFAESQIGGQYVGLYEMLLRNDKRH